MSIDGFDNIDRSRLQNENGVELTVIDTLPNLVARLRDDGLILEFLVADQLALNQALDPFVGSNITDLLKESVGKVLLKKIKEAPSQQQLFRYTDEISATKPASTYEIVIISTGEEEVVVVITNITGKDDEKAAFYRLNRTLLALQSATSAVMLSLNLEQVLDNFTWELTNLLSSCGSAVLEWDPQNELLHPLAVYDKSECFVAIDDLGAELGECPSVKLNLQEKFTSQYSIDRLPRASPEYKFMRTCGINRLLSLPLVFHDRTLGLVISANCRNELEIDDQSISAAQLLTSQAAAAVENARLHAQTEQQLVFHSILREAGQLFSSSLEGNTVLHYIAKRLCVNLGATSAHVLTHDNNEKHRMVVAEYISPSANAKEKVSNLGQTYISDKSDSSCFQDGRSKVWHLHDADIATAEMERMEGSGAKSILAVPIMRSGNVVASAQIRESRRQRRFTEFEIELAEGICQLAALALENAELYKRARHEISERKLAQEALAMERASLADRVAEQTGELRQANLELAKSARLKDEFLANMSHELRTPLNAILGITEGLRDCFYGPLTDQQYESLQLVEKSGQHLLELIDDILDLSRIESGQLSLEKTTVSVDDLCLGCIRLMRQTANRKQISIAYDADGHLHTIYADPRRLKQIIINLLSNAVKFTPETGKVGLEVRTDAETDKIHLTVWDSGIGISERDQKKLFRPFSQIDSRLARRYGGTGLGLVLVKHMTELHDGSVSLESEPNKGSRFTISIPRSKNGQYISNSPASVDNISPALTETTTNCVSIQSGNTQVLLVEDDQINAKIYLDFLRSMNLQTAWAPNAHEAIEYCQENTPDLIIMDIMLPGMDGIATIKHIRKMRDLNRARIIALTALAMAGDRDRCLKAGADMYLSKPVPLATLKKAVQSLIEETVTPESKT